MIRTGRVVTALLAAGAVVALSACGTTDRTVATVDGLTVSADDFDAMARAYLDQPDPTADENVPDDRLSAPIARDLLGQVILGRLIESFLSEREALPTAEVLAEAPLEEWQAELPADILEPLRMYALGNEIIGPAVEDDAAALYDVSAAESGVLCPRLIVVETEDDALDVVAELEAGADFAQLATERSIDPASAANGGITADPNDPSGAECLSTASMSPDAPVGAAALSLTPGSWSAPVSAPIDQQGTTGWFVVTARPYEEVSAEVGQFLGGQVIGQYIDDIEVDVDPMYGRWDAEQFAVVSL